MEELERALLEMDARLRVLEHRSEIVRDLLSRCLIIPIPTPPPPPPAEKERQPADHLRSPKDESE